MGCASCVLSSIKSDVPLRVVCYMFSSSVIKRGFKTSTMGSANIKTAANDFLTFVNASPTPFHAVKSVTERLTKAGFKEIKVCYALSM